MAFIFRREDASRTTDQIHLPDIENKGRTLIQDSLFMLTMVLILIFAAFARPVHNNMSLDCLSSDAQVMV
jgi:hypothetical protein